MSERKTERIVINVEPSVAAAYRQLLHNNGNVGPSEYGRKLIIDKLRACGLMTDKVLATVTV